MLRSSGTFSINLVDILVSRRSGREPSAFGYYFQAADGRAIARRVGEDGPDFLARQFGGFNLPGGKFRQQFFLLRSGRRLNAVIGRSPKSPVSSW